MIHINNYLPDNEMIIVTYDMEKQRQKHVCYPGKCVSLDPYSHAQYGRERNTNLNINWIEIFVENKKVCGYKPLRGISANIVGKISKKDNKQRQIQISNVLYDRVERATYEI